MSGDRIGFVEIALGPFAAGGKRTQFPGGGSVATLDRAEEAGAKLVWPSSDEPLKLFGEGQLLIAGVMKRFAQKPFGRSEVSTLA